jgi:hypothetical protein
MPVDEPLALLYCLTRDRDLAAAVDERLPATLAFFYNDAARLHQAVVLRAPDLVLLDTDAVRPEYGDAGLGPVVAFLHERCPAARVAVRPGTGADWLMAAEAGPMVEMLPHPLAACLDALRAFSDRLTQGS